MKSRMVEAWRDSPWEARSWVGGFGTIDDVDDDASILTKCGYAIWAWDHGYQGDLDDIISTALREGWKCPPAFIDILDDIRSGLRPVPERRLSKLKATPPVLFFAALDLLQGRSVERRLLRDRRENRMLLRPDPDPVAFRRASEQRVRDLETTMAQEVGVSVATLRRAERQVRDLYLSLIKK